MEPWNTNVTSGLATSLLRIHFPLQLTNRVQGWDGGYLGGREGEELVVDVAVIHGVIALDHAGVAHCEPAHHQVLDVRLCLLASSEAQGVAAPLTRAVGDDFGFETHRDFSFSPAEGAGTAETPSTAAEGAAALIQANCFDEGRY